MSEYSHPEAEPAWTSPEAGRLLAGLAEGHLCLEVGAYHGFTTTILARAARHVVTVDDLSYSGGWDECREMLRLHGCLERVTMVTGRMQEVLPAMATCWAGLAFYDAGHSREETMVGMGLCRACLLPGGWLAVHDYGHGGFPEVAPAVDELADAWLAHVRVAGGTAFIRPGWGGSRPWRR